jgi:hypothetical protein
MRSCLTKKSALSFSEHLHARLFNAPLGKLDGSKAAACSAG